MKEEKNITNLDLLNAIGKSNKDVFKAINNLAEFTKKGFLDADKKLTEAVDFLAATTKEQFDEIGERFDKMDEQFDKMDGRLTKVEAMMVTKDYLDEKMADLRGGLITVIRKEDTKVKTLTNILHTKKVIDKKEKDKIFSLEPFPDLKLNMR